MSYLNTHVPRRTVPKRGRGRGTLITIAALLLALVAAVGFAVLYQSYNAETTKTCTVSDKNRTQKTVDGNSTMETRLYTQECGTFRVEDAFHKGHFNSGDTYGKLQVGKTYRLTYYGYRIPFLSSFPNVIRVSEAQ